MSSGIRCSRHGRQGRTRSCRHAEECRKLLLLVDGEGREKGLLQIISCSTCPEHLLDSF